MKIFENNSLKLVSSQMAKRRNKETCLGLFEPDCSFSKQKIKEKFFYIIKILFTIEDV